LQNKGSPMEKRAALYFILLPIEERMLLRRDGLTPVSHPVSSLAFGGV
jgi:hypothetical protein